MPKFVMSGGRPLRGSVTVAGSKNAALPCLAATLLARTGTTTLTNVPQIADVASMIELLEFVGCRVTRRGHTVTVDARRAQSTALPHERVSRLRASLLLLGPLLARFGKATLAFPGGCVIGKRPVDAHLAALRALGARVTNGVDRITASAPRGLRASRFLMEETSVTATENALMAAALTPGVSEIRLAAAEPHVENVAELLTAMGSRVEGKGTNTIRVHGRRQLHGVRHRVVGDYLEMGTLAIAAALVPDSRVRITGVNPHQLDAVWNKLREMGGAVRELPNGVEVRYRPGLRPLSKLETRVHPGFPTDLQAPFAVLLTQASGPTPIFETLYEGRFNYLNELEKMGAKVEIHNPHQAVVTGPTKLRGTAVDSCDLRAGATVVLAGLVARGTTEVYNINYVDRGYERLDEVLRRLGAAIERVD